NFCGLEILMKAETKEVLYTLKKTRKAFLWEYTCGIILLLLPSVLTLKGIILKSAVVNVIFGIAILSIVSAEISRAITRYKITEDKLIITHGIVKQKRRNVYFAPLGFLPSINFKQSRLQRLLNYGTVYISAAAGEENNFEIKDINKPKRVLEVIEELIERNRRRSSMSIVNRED
ncbi:MAG TPA: PH domain-containing protein, partial [Candidatus Nanoarchaeia archaeon]|nr:PH domain-containing protein [Candidatus Nanoarchaeia archaeon]